MKLRRLGKTELQVSEIGFGGEWLERHPEADGIELIRYASAQGINILDCWMPDPKSRDIIGKGIRENRGQWYIQGHIGSAWKDEQYFRTRDTKYVRPAFEDLLKRLQTDYIDLGMIHYVDSEKEWEQIQHSAYLDYIMELKNLYRGRIREYAEQYPGVKYVEGAKPWFEKADIALPSATQNELNGDHARQLVANGCMAVSEGANMPSTPEAIKVFQDAKILYAPGKAANAGGVSVSGLEMTQNSIKLSWSAEEVDEKLKSIMKNIHEACVQYGTEADGYVNYVKGANVAGFMKVAKAMMAQGIV
mgnify:CR=1 FL=1